MNGRTVSMYVQYVLFQLETEKGFSESFPMFFFSFSY